MKMHEHDQEIIMALAEENLDEVAATAAQAEIEGCAECSRDLELQRLALSVLDEAPDVYLTATESSRLHESLKRELTGLRPAPTSNKPTVAWGRWVSALAGTAAVFLVVFMVLPNVIGGSDDSSPATTAAADGGAFGDEERSTAAATETIAPEILEMGGSADDAATDYQASIEASEAPMASTTTAAASETTASGLGLADVLPLIGYGNISEEIRAEIVDQLLLSPDDVRLRDELAKSAAFDLPACLAELALELGIPSESETILVGVLAGDDGAERLVVAFVPAEVNDTTLVVVTYPAGCEIFQLVP